jgi:hypothetical protein
VDESRSRRSMGWIRRRAILILLQPLLANLDDMAGTRLNKF